MTLSPSGIERAKDLGIKITFLLLLFEGVKAMLFNGFLSLLPEN